MRLGLFIRLFFMLLFTGLLLYFYVHKQNQIAKLRLEIPQLEQQVDLLKEQTTELNFEIDQHESPKRLFALLKDPNFSHLRIPNGE